MTRFMKRRKLFFNHILNLKKGEWAQALKKKEILKNRKHLHPWIEDFKKN